MALEIFDRFVHSLLTLGGFNHKFIVVLSSALASASCQIIQKLYIV